MTDRDLPGVLGVHTCGGPLSENPHPEAGLSTRFTEVGYSFECIPCLVRTRSRWSERARTAERKVELLRKALEDIGPTCRNFAISCYDHIPEGLWCGGCVAFAALLASDDSGSDS